MYSVTANIDSKQYSHEKFGGEFYNFDDCAMEKLDKLSLKQEIELKNTTNLIALSNTIYNIDCRAPNDTIEVNINLMKSKNKEFYHDKR